MPVININGKNISITNIKPYGKHITISKAYQNYYGLLSKNKPNQVTLTLKKGNETYYLINAGKHVTGIDIHFWFNNGRGTSSRARIKEIYVYDGSGQDVTKHFSFSESKIYNGKAYVSGTWHNLIDRNQNTEVLGYCKKSNDGNAGYTVYLRSTQGIYMKKLKVIFGHYQDSSGHDGHTTYININGKREWTTDHQAGWLEFERDFEN